ALLLQPYYNCTVLTTVILFVMLYEPKNCSTEFFIVLKIKQMSSIYFFNALIWKIKTLIMVYSNCIIFFTCNNQHRYGYFICKLTIIFPIVFDLKRFLSEFIITRVCIIYLVQQINILFIIGNCFAIQPFFG